MDSLADGLALLTEGALAVLLWPFEGMHVCDRSLFGGRGGWHLQLEDISRSSWWNQLEDWRLESQGVVRRLLGSIGWWLQCRWSQNNATLILLPRTCMSLTEIEFFCPRFCHWLAAARWSVNRAQFVSCSKLHQSVLWWAKAAMDQFQEMLAYLAYERICLSCYMTYVTEFLSETLVLAHKLFHWHSVLTLILNHWSWWCSSSGLFESLDQGPTKCAWKWFAVTVIATSCHLGQSLHGSQSNRVSSQEQMKLRPVQGPSKWPYAFEHLEVAFDINSKLLPGTCRYLVFTTQTCG